MYSTSRLAAASFWTGTCWITGGVVYGYASQAHTQEVQDDTNDLLHQLTMQVVEGPHSMAFIAGDFNQLPGVLSEILQWEAKGWKDVQTIALEKWGVQPTPTCKRTTRKDFIYISPQLQKYMVSASNSYDRFPDHSILSAYIDIPTALPPEAFWFKPDKITFHSEEEINEIQRTKVFVAEADTPDEKYQKIFQEYEKVVHSHKIANGKPGLLPNQKGRATCVERKFRPAQVTPLKPSRPSEVASTFHGRSLQHKRWFTQLRRLQAYVAVAHSKKLETEPAENDHSWKVWKAIRYASGFHISFSDWWGQRTIRNIETVKYIPKVPPNYLQALSIYTSFEAEVRQLEATLREKRKDFVTAQQRRELSQVFRDVRKPGPLPVQVLLTKQNTVVAEVVDDHSLILEHPIDIELNTPITNTKGFVKVTQVEGNTISTNVPHQLVPGDTISQEELHGAVEDIHKKFADEWTKRWDKHLGVAESYWDEISGFIDLALPSQEMQYEPIDLPTWKNSFMKKSHTAATGLDGVSRQDLIALPNELHVEIIKILHNAEQTGVWPEKLLHGAIHALAKVPAAETVQQFRPITILPLVYRCWATIRSKQSLQHLEKVAPPSMLGNMPGRTTAEIWWTLQADLETSMNQ